MSLDDPAVTLTRRDLLILLVLLEEAYSEEDRSQWYVLNQSLWDKLVAAVDKVVDGAA